MKTLPEKKALKALKALKVLDQYMTIRVIKPGHHKYLAWEHDYILQFSCCARPISQEEYDILKAAGIPDREEE